MHRPTMAATALTLLLTGAVLGQAFSNSDLRTLSGSSADQAVANMQGAISQYTIAIDDAKSAAQVTQLTGETALRLQVIQIQQQAETIRLLKVIAAKK